MCACTHPHIHAHTNANKNINVAIISIATTNTKDLFSIELIYAAIQRLVGVAYIDINAFAESGISYFIYLYVTTINNIIRATNPNQKLIISFFLSIYVLIIFIYMFIFNNNKVLMPL